MTVIATASNPRFSVSRVDIDRDGPDLHDRHPARPARRSAATTVELYFITGADALAQILTWRDVDELFELAHFVGVTRPGHELADPGLPDGPGEPGRGPRAGDLVDRLRERVASQAGPIWYLVPDGVVQYIAKRDLYAGRPPRERHRQPGRQPAVTNAPRAQRAAKPGAARPGTDRLAGRQTPAQPGRPPVPGAAKPARRRPPRGRQPPQREEQRGRRAARGSAGGGCGRRRGARRAAGVFGWPVAATTCQHRTAAGPHRTHADGHPRRRYRPGTSGAALVTGLRSPASGRPVRAGPVRGSSSTVSTREAVPVRRDRAARRPRHPGDALADTLDVVMDETWQLSPTELAHPGRRGRAASLVDVDVEILGRRRRRAGRRAAGGTDQQLERSRRQSPSPPTSAPGSPRSRGWRASARCWPR